MEIPAGLCPKRLDMAVVTGSLTFEQLIASLGAVYIKVDTWCRYGCRNGELIEMERGKFGSDFIVVRRDMQMTEAVSRGNRKLCRIIETRIEERTYSMHLEVGN